MLPIPYAIYAGAAGIASSVSNSAVTASSLNTVGTPTSGQVLSYTGSGLSWITPAGNGGLTLPYSGSASSSSSLFTLQNTGSGPAGAFLGKVGIGTTSPAAALHVSSSGTFYAPQLQLTQTTPGDYARIRMGDGASANWDIAAGIGTDNSLHFYAQGQNRMTITPNGNVGIGTTSPQNPLDVQFSTPAANLSDISSQGTSAVKGTYVPAGAYGALAYTYYVPPPQIANPMNSSTKTSTVQPPSYSTQTITYGVYGNGGNGDYAGYFDGPVNVNGQVAVSSIRSPGAGINSGTFAFTQQAVSGNTQGNGTKIFNSLCDGDPNAILIITHNWGADTNSTSQFNTKPVGVYYNSSIAHWVILNEDNSAMALGRAFNVMIIKP